MNKNTRRMQDINQMSNNPHGKNHYIRITLMIKRPNKHKNKRIHTEHTKFYSTLSMSSKITTCCKELCPGNEADLNFYFLLQIYVPLDKIWPILYECLENNQCHQNFVVRIKIVIMIIISNNVSIRTWCWATNPLRS